jgi:cytidylate kinase
MPIITISRGTLSGGRATAECLASRLGYPCVGREIVQEAAKRLGASVEALSSKFESPPRGLMPFTKERETYLLAVQTALADQCANGNLVYHGLAGQFLLQGLPCVIRVRLIAPLDMRVRALTAAHHRTGHRAAEEFIRKTDRGRRRWVRLMYGADIDDPALYDLTINLQAISLETACSVIAELAAQPQYQRTDDVTAELKTFAAACHARLSEKRED